MTEELTGAEVERRRKALGLSRRELAERCGFPSESRIMNIERKESWKRGNQQLLERVLGELEAAPPRDPRGRLPHETAEQRVERLMGALEQNGHALHLLGNEAEPLDPYEGTLVTILPDDEPAPAEVPADEGAAVAQPVTPMDVDPFLDDDDDDDLEPNWLPLDDPDDQSTESFPLDRPLTNSEVATWQRCRRKWWLTFYRRLIYGQVDYFGARSIGNRVHRALEIFYRDGTDARAALEAAIEADWQAIVTQVNEHGVPGHEDTLLAELAGRFQDATQLERAMVEGYVQWLEETGADANYKVVGAEQVVSGVLRGEVAGEPVEVMVTGKMDARLERLSDGARLFMDHKTVDQFTAARKVLHLDAQILHYHLLEWLATQGESYCQGALYNMLRKVKRTAQAKPPFYERVEVHRNAHEVESYRQRLLGAARDIQRVTRELDAGAAHLQVVYPNPTKACSWDCDYFLICPLFDDGSRVEDAIASMYREGDPLERYSKDQEGLGI